MQQNIKHRLFNLNKHFPTEKWILGIFLTWWGYSTFSSCKKSICFLFCTGIYNIQVGCCSPTRYNVFSSYEHAKDLPVHIPMWTMVLVPVPILIIQNVMHYGLHVNITTYMVFVICLRMTVNPGVHPEGQDSIQVTSTD